MSYTEYVDIFDKAQKRDCPFVAFFVDVVNSKENILGKDEMLAHYNFIDKLTLALKDKMKIDKNNVLYFVHNQQDVFADLRNPIIIGDGTCYFFEKDKISQKEFEMIAIETMKKTNYPFDLHLCSCHYETEDYAKANSKLYKGYVFRLLEDQKNNDVILNKNTTIEYEDEK